MSEQKDQTGEIRRLERMLQGIVRTARDASLTGRLAGGRAIAARQYNTILARLQELGLLPHGLFEPLSEEATFDEVGVAAMSLAHFLQDEAAEAEVHARRGGGFRGGVFEATPGHVKIVGFPGHIGELRKLFGEKPSRENEA